MPRIKPKVEDFLDENSYNHQILIAMCRAGCSMDEIGARFGVDKSTLYRWIEKNTAFATLMLHAREDATKQVENALMMASTGYYKDVEVLDKQGNIRVIKQWFPPNPNAQTFFLKNRNGTMWKEKQEIAPDSTALDKLDSILTGLFGKAKDDAQSNDEAKDEDA